MQFDPNYFKKINKWDIGYIYIVKCMDFFKLGSASLPEQRIQLIKTDNPMNIEVLYVKKVFWMSRTERELHDFLKSKKYHHRGEWFKYGPKIVSEMINALEEYMESNQDEIQQEGLEAILKNEYK